MRLAIALLSSVLACSTGLVLVASNVYPDRGLAQVVVWGWYEPKDPKRLDEFRREVVRQGRLKPGELFEEKYEHLMYSLNENYQYTTMSYCHDERPVRETAFGNEFRIRLYDRENRLLAERPLRYYNRGIDDDGGTADDYSTVGYLPYRETGHEIRIVKVRSRKETVLEAIPFLSRSELVRVSQPYNSGFSYRRIGWVFDLDTQCFVAPPLR